VIGVAFEASLKQDCEPVFIQLTSESTRWSYWFHTKLSLHILQQNCALGRLHKSGYKQ